MQLKHYPDMLLFSKESSGWLRHTLYFVAADSLDFGSGKIYRFSVLRKSQFEDFALGGIYSLECLGGKIHSYVCENRYALSDTEYFSLILQRDLQFLSNRNRERIGIDATSYRPADYYYSIVNIQKLLEYRPSRLHRIIFWIAQMFFGILAYLLPIFIYLLYVFFVSSCAASSNAGIFGGILLALITLAAIPFLLFGMRLSGQLYEELMLRMNSFKFDLLQQYALEWAGMRRNIGIQREEVQPILRLGFWTGGAALLGLLLAIILL